jgi:hypothetical protein
MRAFAVLGFGKPRHSGAGLREAKEAVERLERI